MRPLSRLALSGLPLTALSLTALALHALAVTACTPTMMVDDDAGTDAPRAMRDGGPDTRVPYDAGMPVRMG